jgi:hypothetical protein
MLLSLAMMGVATTLLLSGCGGDPNAVNPLPVADAAADAAHDAGDAAPKLEDAAADAD